MKSIYIYISGLVGLECLMNLCAALGTFLFSAGIHEQNCQMWMMFLPMQGVAFCGACSCQSIAHITAPLNSCCSPVTVRQDLPIVTCLGHTKGCCLLGLPWGMDSSALIR